MEMKKIGPVGSSGGSRIFPRGGREPSRGGVNTPNFPENCMKSKEFGRPGGACVPHAPPPRSANGECPKFYYVDLPLVIAAQFVVLIFSEWSFLTQEVAVDSQKEEVLQVKRRMKRRTPKQHVHCHSWNMGTERFTKVLLN